MTRRKISDSGVTTTTPAQATDLIPIARPGDSTARRVAASEFATAAAATANAAAAVAAAAAAAAAQATADAAVPKAGGTLTGAVIAAADPLVALGLATKQYVDSVIGGAYTAEMITLANALSAAPSSYRLAAIDRMIGSLKAAGVWTKIAVLQDYTAAAVADFGVDWKTPSRTKPTFVGSVTKTINKEFHGDGSTAIAQTGLIPNALGLANSSFGVSIWCNDGTATNAENGVRASGNVRMRFDTGSFFSGVNDADGGLATITTSTSDSGGTYGLSTHQHISSANREAFFNGVKIGATDTSSTAGTLVASQMYLGALNNGGSVFGAHTTAISFLIVHSLLTAAEVLAMFNALVRYQSDIANYRKAIAAWGDSETQGPAGLNAPYPNQIAILSDPWRRWYNGGISGQTTAQIAARMVADTTYTDRLQIIQGGYNDLKFVTAGTAPAKLAAALAGIATMVARAQALGVPYVVVGTHNGDSNDVANGGPGNTGEYTGGTEYTNILAYNSALSNLYGSRYVDPRTPLMAGGTGTGGDATDVANGVVPRSLRGDYFHLNAAGQVIEGLAVYNVIAALGY